MEERGIGEGGRELAGIATEKSGLLRELTKLVEVGFHFICRRLLTNSSDEDLFGFVRLAF